MLTDFFLSRGYSFFASGWTQFAAAFGLSFLIMFFVRTPVYCGDAPYPRQGSADK